MTESTPARTAALVPAAGRGERLGPGAPKALRAIGGEPILLHAVRGLLASGEVDLVVVAAPPTEEGVAEVARILTGLDPVTVVPGGATRQQSVALALAAVPEQGYDVILVHDAARALTPPATIAAVVAAVRSGLPAVIPVLPVADTIKSAVPSEDPAGFPTVGDTVDRSGLRAVQTPQGFRRDLLTRAHAAAGHDATDDAGLVESLGEPVGMIPGHVEAFKVTTPFDLVLAEAVLERREEQSRMNPVLPLVGIGVDVHAFATEQDLDLEPRPLRLAGLDWPGQSGLLGHSDADVVCHAACNALFSAAGLGDLGSNFGTSEPEWKGAAGTVLLAEAARRVRAAGFVIGNVAVQVIGVRPKIGPRRAEAEAVLAAAVGAPVRLSAATTDGLGFTGRAEGLTGIATAVVFPAG
ncbi:2-C-methyl-D-erythritol 4-phosphate cytidylyltransferase [Actinospica sp.]|uniref:2-C-methyl-D-erythritol 4-phosphate cytidylyltransferase n=1 Tax=Actinospica sp. TaxID=1872142 RepID=UPI002B6270AB|nr:2-C-methyl-D-erythritol 4-phosphate cytidylyltransferase [Actinospica sp.]HWG22641.1 2-C-methyl-D-erythritol 4-phosphate cytidylyltransferase [Actinospica sp.]